MKLGANFSDDRLYRYNLFRIWNDTAPVLVFVLLNPSTADETRDDPTIKRCIGRALNGGYGGIEVVNLFAWRSTYPVNLVQSPDPVGPRNNRMIRQAVMRQGVTVICGWGKWGSLHNRGPAVLDLIRGMGAVPMALGLNADGSPKHPLYLGYAVKPFPMP